MMTTVVNRINYLANFLTTPRIGSLPVENPDTHKTIRREEVQPQSQIQPNVISQQPPNRTETPPLSFQEAINEFINLLAPVPSTTSALYTNSEEINSWRVRRAGMLGMLYSDLPKETLKPFQGVLAHLIQHDEVPVNKKEDNFEYRKTFEEVLNIWDKSYDLFSGFFTHFAYATRRTGQDSYSIFQRFLEQVGKTRLFGRWYKTFNPPRITDFPGPGFVLYGIKSTVFPSGFITSLREEKHEYDLPYTRVQKEYREYLVEGERELSHTTFGLFRGLLIVRNPKMIVDKERKALVVFNDHFHNPDQEIAFLIPDKVAESFLKNPVQSTNEQSYFYPEGFWAKHKDTLINLTWPSVLGGMDKALPVGKTYYEGSTFFDKSGNRYRRHLLEFEQLYGPSETYDRPQGAGFIGHYHRTHMFGGYWSTDFNFENLKPFKVAHDEITRCTLFAHAQIDLLKEAFRLYCYGWQFNHRTNKWELDEYRLLREVLSWKESPRLKRINEDPPILTPVKRLRCANIDPDMLSTTGVVDTKSMRCHREVEFGDFELPHRAPPRDKNLQRDWVNTSGDESVSNWEWYRNVGYETGADLIFLSPVALPTILGIINK